jgi:nitroreductase
LQEWDVQLRDAIQSRQSVKNFDPRHLVSDDELRELFRWVVLTPSSFNTQAWKFVVVRDQAAKARLCERSYNQSQVSHCSAVVAVLGQMNAHEDADRLYAAAPAAVREKVIPMIHNFYAGSPQLQRDEAIRSCSLAAMTLMLLAEDMGYATCPMIGFDAEGVSRFLKVDDQHFPVMLICLGKRSGPAQRARDPRRPLAEIARLESFDGHALAE